MQSIFFDRDEFDIGSSGAEGRNELFMNRPQNLIASIEKIFRYRQRNDDVTDPARLNEPDPHALGFSLDGLLDDRQAIAWRFSAPTGGQI
jgi:hypothetical protein